MADNTQNIHEIRQFNRFYTDTIGLLNQHILESNLSLSEVRVLYEIWQQEKTTAGQLVTLLNIDGGYLSRMLKKFEKKGWLHRQQSNTDGRTFLLHLSAAGKRLMSNLDEKSTTEIEGMIAPLSAPQQGKLTNAMHSIQELLSGTADKSLPKVTFRYTLQPGDVGYLIYLHGHLYAKESGYNLEFEAYVCKTFYEFLPAYNPAKDRMILAIADGQIVGSVAILASSRHLVQLRWFLIHPDYRGQGLGKWMLEEAIAFCKEKHYQKIYLMTTSMQHTAIGLYTKMGFRKTGEKFLQLWGQQLYEQRYDMDLI
jgi:DNA-binding MarR family transcriptional regulator/GNAT superfamily N-acetyltransferase